MKKLFFPLILYSIFPVSLHPLETFTVNDSIDKQAIAGLFTVLKQFNDAYIKHDQINSEWIKHSSDFKDKVNTIRQDTKNIIIVPHPTVLQLPTITIDKSNEKIFCKALGSIEPMLQKLYNADANLVKKIFYGLIHHHLVIVKQNGKHIIVFGTQCKDEAHESAQDTKKAIKLFKNKLPFRLKLKFAIIMLSS